VHIVVQNDDAVGSIGERESHVYQYTLSHGKMSQFEQQANIKFCVKLGKTGEETVQMMRDVYQEECMSQPRTYEWYLWSKVGRVLLAVGKRKGRPLNA